MFNSLISVPLGYTVKSGNGTRLNVNNADKSFLSTSGITFYNATNFESSEFRLKLLHYSNNNIYLYLD